MVMDFTLSRRFLGLALLMGALSNPAIPQQTQQNVPDAPSATRPANQLPKSVPPPATTAPDATQQETPAPPPPNIIKTVPAGSVPNDPTTASRDDLYKIIVRVNQVTVPVTVKDSNSRLVEGLLKNDF